LVGLLFCDHVFLAYNLEGL